jgi:hypothetical protein
LIHSVYIKFSSYICILELDKNIDMGNLVTLTLHTDELDQVEKFPKKFGKAVYEAVCRGGGKRDGFLPNRFGDNGSFIMQKVRHSSVDALYFQSGNTITEIGSNIDVLEKDVQIIQASLTRLKKRIKEKKESV